MCEKSPFCELIVYIKTIPTRATNHFKMHLW